MKMDMGVLNDRNIEEVGIQSALVNYVRHSKVWLLMVSYC